jgi:hypothetical protein
MKASAIDTISRLKIHYSNSTKGREKLNPIFLSSTPKSDNIKSQSFMELL